MLAGVGLLLNGPLDRVDDAEDKVTDAFNRNRTDFWDPISWVFSRFGNTEVVIGACLNAEEVPRERVSAFDAGAKSAAVRGPSARRSGRRSVTAT